ncbi:hypothetical protein RF679_16995 [Undibacterium cyanobacteriorum]|uniref:Uncharacterized protein n=1 Tax=Undibacterium cyanobacteriorum TaxID=3073561 RepID=A0ABY9RI30_9BURK|nr:hypothetical protein [Undibacterium sp. 20NA77.5]WMW80325.1 hypothetical protein RF679_16995 [Undibacterium sp. 20NA77.5]
MMLEASPHSDSRFQTEPQTEETTQAQEAKQPQLFLSIHLHQQGGLRFDLVLEGRETERRSVQGSLFRLLREVRRYRPQRVVIAAGELERIRKIAGIVLSMLQLAMPRCELRLKLQGH